LVNVDATVHILIIPANSAAQGRLILSLWLIPDSWHVRTVRTINVRNVRNREQAGLNITSGINLFSQETDLERSRNPLQKGPLHKDSENIKHYYSVTKSVSGS